MGVFFSTQSVTEPADVSAATADALRADPTKVDDVTKEADKRAAVIVSSGSGKTVFNAGRFIGPIRAKLSMGLAQRSSASLLDSWRRERGKVLASCWH
jgi:hypothetical protein